MSAKSQRIGKLIALNTMLSEQKRDRNGSAKFNKDQLQAAIEVVEQVLKIDHIVPAEQAIAKHEGGK